MSNDTLNIAEIPYPDSNIVHFRYARYMSNDKTRWIRHGLFQQFHENGSLASEGEYAEGKEQGLWRDYHENGLLAAEGQYLDGSKIGTWKYFDDTGSPDETETY